MRAPLRRYDGQAFFWGRHGKRAAVAVDANITSDVDLSDSNGNVWVMKQSTVVALIVFIALAAAAVMSLNQKLERGITRISLSEVDPEAVDRIEITGEKPVVLEKKQGKWVLAGNGRQAELSSVEGLIKALEKVKSSDLVTRDSERYGELKVDDAGGARVKVSVGGKEVANFVVGDSVGGGAYVRIDEGVYRVERLPRTAFVRDMGGWEKRKLFDDTLDQVTKVEVALSGQQPYTLLKKDKGYALEDPSVLPEGFRFDEGAARGLVSSLLNVRVKEILDADPGVETTGLGEEADVLRYFASEKQEATEEGGAGKDEGAAAVEPIRVGALKIGKSKDSDSFYGQVEGSKDVVLLQGYTSRALRKAATEFRDLSMMDFDSASATELVVKAGGVNLVLEKKGTEWEIKKSKEKPAADFELGSSQVTQRVSALARARAIAVASGVSAGAAGVAGNGPYVAVKGADGKEARLRIGKSLKHDGRDAFYAKGNADDNVYIIPKWTHDNLTGGLAKLKKVARPGGGGGHPSLDPESMADLPPELRRMLKDQLKKNKSAEDIMKAINAGNAKRGSGGPKAASK